MIPIYSDDAGTRASFTFNGQTFNAAATADDHIWLMAVQPRTVYQSVSDDKPTGDGIEVYEPYKRSKALRLHFDIADTSRAALYDKLELVAKTFDPVLVHRANSSVFGFIALDFSVPTVDTATYATGLIPSRYYARPVSTLDVLPYSGGSLALRAAIDLVLRDPRRYAQSTANRTGSGALTNSKGDYPSWATVTTTMSGAGSATYAVQNANTYYTRNLVLNLSGLVNTDVVVIDMEIRQITVNGTVDMSVYVSGDYWEVGPGSNTVTVTNGTNASTVIEYRPAYSL